MKHKQLSINCIINKGVLIILFNNENYDTLHLPLSSTFFIEYRAPDKDIEFDKPKVFLSFSNTSTLYVNAEDAEDCVSHIQEVIREYYFKNESSI